MPAYRPTANCIWRSFRASSKKHLILTGSRGSGKSTLLSALFPQPMPGLTSYVVPEDGVYMKENLSGETVQIGRYQADAPGNTNKMQPVPEAFLTKGIEFLDMCIRQPSDWITIDETGYLEQTMPAYQEAISRLLAAKHVLLVVRKQKLPFLDSLCKRDDCFLVDLDKPYGDAFCIIMASGKSKRFGANKLLTDFNGKPLIAYAFDATEMLGQNRLVVTIHPEIAHICKKQDIPFLLHNLPDRNDMIRLGTGAIKNKASHCLFLPSDQPLVSRETIGALLFCAKNTPDTIWRTCDQNTAGSPVVFPSAYFDDLSALPPKNGGNTVIQNHREHVRLLPVTQHYELADIDTPEDMQAMEVIAAHALAK